MQKCKTTSVQFLNSSTVGVLDAPGGVVDANRLLLLKVGVGLLTAGGGPSGGGVGCHGAGDVVVARRLTLSGGLLSFGRGSLRGRGSCGGFFWAFAMVLIQRGRAPFPHLCSSSTPLELA